MSMLRYWIWLSSLSTGALRPEKAKELLAYYGSPRDIYFAAAAEYKTVTELRESEISALEEKSFDTAEKILENCKRLGVTILTMQDTAYPDRLRNIYDPPAVLYVLGRLPDIDSEAAVAMVGSRESSAYGLVTAEKLAGQIAAHGGIIVSGMAKGIDAAAHRGALINGGITIAVLAGGPDDIYPRQNRELYEDIVATGAVVSEIPPAMGEIRRDFPRRNRIISGLSISVVVVEAAEHSGTRHTVREALSQGREVFAVPGNIDAENSIGCNRLIGEGAIPVTSGWDILREAQPLFPDKIKAAPYKKPIDTADNREEPAAVKGPRDDLETMSPEERAIFSLLLDKGVMQADDIIEATRMSAQQTLSALTLLELRGSVMQKSAGVYQICPAE